MTSTPTVAEPAVGVGAQAPKFTVSDCDGTWLDTDVLLKKGPLVVAFYPKAKTSGCTQEMQAFVREADMLGRYRATVIAVSRDSAETLKTFRDELHATFSFVPDTDGKLMRLYGAKMPVVTVAKRKTFVINQAGTIVHMAEGSDAIALKGVEAALAALNPHAG